MKFGPVVQEEMLFKEKVYGLTDRWRTDGQPITIAHPELKKNRRHFQDKNMLAEKGLISLIDN